MCRRTANRLVCTSTGVKICTQIYFSVTIFFQKKVESDVTVGLHNIPEGVNISHFSWASQRPSQRPTEVMGLGEGDSSGSRSRIVETFVFVFVKNPTEGTRVWVLG